MATSGVAGLVYARTLVDISTGEKIDVKDLIEGSEGGSTAWADITGKPETFPLQSGQRQQPPKPVTMRQLGQM